MGENQRLRMFFEGVLSKIAETEAEKVEILQRKKIMGTKVTTLIKWAKATASGNGAFFAFGKKVLKQLSQCFSCLTQGTMGQQQIRELIKSDPDILDFMYEDCIQ